MLDIPHERAGEMVGTLRAFKDHKLYVEGLSAQTVHSYLNAARNFLIYVDKFPADITTGDCIRWLKNLAEQGLHQNTRNTYAVAVRAYIRFLHDTGVVFEPPNMPVPKRRHQPRQFLYPDEVHKLLMATDNLRDKAIIAFLYASGVRVSELCALNIKNVYGDEVMVDGKGGRPRMVYIDPRTAKLLNLYISTREDFEPALFITRRVKRIIPIVVRGLIDKTAHKANLDKPVSPHILRHSFASTLIRNGANIKHVQVLLGHSQLSTTQIYTHLSSPEVKSSYKSRFY